MTNTRNTARRYKGSRIRPHSTLPRTSVYFPNQQPRHSISHVPSLSLSLSLPLFYTAALRDTASLSLSVSVLSSPTLRSFSLSLFSSYFWPRDLTSMRACTYRHGRKERERERNAHSRVRVFTSLRERGNVVYFRWEKSV